MKSFMCLTLLGLVLFVAYANAGCDDNSKESEEGDVKTWFKNLGCSIKKGAEDLSEQAKPIASKIGETAKDFGNTVAQKYDELKHKLTDDTSQSASTPTPINLSAPTEKVPLAPLQGDVPALSATTGEQKEQYGVTPASIDDRFLLQPNECPKGQVLDHRNMCRPA